MSKCHIKTEVLKGGGGIIKNIIFLPDIIASAPGKNMTGWFNNVDFINVELFERQAQCSKLALSKNVSSVL